MLIIPKQYTFNARKVRHANHFHSYITLFCNWDGEKETHRGLQTMSQHAQHFMYHMFYHWKGHFWLVVVMQLKEMSQVNRNHLACQGHWWYINAFSSTPTSALPSGTVIFMLNLYHLTTIRNYWLNFKCHF